MKNNYRSLFYNELAYKYVFKAAEQVYLRNQFPTNLEGIRKKAPADFKDYTDKNKISAIREIRGRKLYH